MPPVEDLWERLVPSSLTNNRDIDSILRAADEIQDEDATISRILCEHAYSLAQNLDPNSEGVLQFKTGLMSAIKQKLAKRDGGIDRSQDIARLREFYKLYREKNRVDKMQEEQMFLRESGTFSGNIGELEGKTVKRRRVFATLKVLGTVLEQLSSEVSPEDADRLIPAEEDASLREKLNKCEVQPESARSSSEMNLLTLGASSHKIWVDREETSNTAEGDHMLVPAIPAGVSGTALAASLLRDGWSLAKLYAKYQEAVDARKDAEAVMELVLYEIEEKTPLILAERAEHKRLMEAYSAANQKLQRSQSEQTSLQKTILDLKVYLRSCERDFDVSQKQVFDLQKQVTVLTKECRDIQLRCGSTQITAESDAQRVISEHLVKSLEEDLAKLRMERDKMTLEAKLAQEKLNGSMEEFQHQRADRNDLISRNVELQRRLVDYQQKVRESSDSMWVAEELSRKLSMEVSVLKQEKEILVTSEKRASDEVGSLSKRVHRLQATLEAIQSTEEVREEARGTERRIKEEYIKRIEKEWAEAKKDLQQERDSARTLRLERQGSFSAMKQVVEMGKELSNALHAVATAESKAAVAEARLSDLEKTSQALASLQKEASDLRNVANLLKAEKLKVKGKDSQLQEIQRSISEKDEKIFHLEQEVGRCRTELDDSKGRVNELLKVEASLKSDVENQKKVSLHFKREFENLLKDKEDFNSLKSCMLTASRIIFQAPGIPSAEERERRDKLFRRMVGFEEEPNNGGKPLNVDTQTQPATRKRSTSELAGPLQKKSKGQYSIEGQDTEVEQEGPDPAAVDVEQIATVLDSG